jgi:hypothetical protein
MWYKDAKTLKNPEIQAYQLTVGMNIMNMYGEKDTTIRNQKDIVIEAWLLGAVGMSDHKMPVNTSYIR